LEEPHLYTAMFSRDSTHLRNVSAHDQEAAAATFTSLLDRIERCTGAGRWEVADVVTAGEMVWAAIHGHTVLELGGFSSPYHRPRGTVLAELLVHLSIGFGDQPEAARRSLARARRRS
ncbi:MAG: TetR-like C-terminal domain-containing protein, partial [Acidimicrobiales bacterium]